jgi:hypothetical protein
VPSSELTLMATARRQDDGIYIELRRAPAGVEAEPRPRAWRRRR